MGLFGGVKDIFRKTEAAVIVQHALEDTVTRIGYEGDPAKVANLLVGALWRHKPDVFSGSYGQRPHKLAVAIAALAAGLSSWREQFHRGHYAYALALAGLLSEIKENGALYPFSTMDWALIEESAAIFAGFSEEMPGSDMLEKLGL